MRVSKLAFLSILFSAASYFPKEAEGANAVALCLRETNLARKREGKIEMFYDEDLARAAKHHTDYMIANNCFAHQCPAELNLESRTTKAGYNWVTIEENIAGDAHNCNQAVRQWLKVPNDRARLLGDSYHLGCALSRCLKRQCNYRSYITCLYANPKIAGSPRADPYYTLPIQQPKQWR